MVLSDHRDIRLCHHSLPALQGNYIPDLYIL